MNQIRNPKSEIRRKSESAIKKAKIPTGARLFRSWVIRISDFLRISDFGLRIFGFGP